MLISVDEMTKIFDIKPNGVLHIGAHLAEESIAYESFGWLPVIWIEANPTLVKIMKDNLHPSKHTIFQAAISDINGEKENIYLSNNSQSSSMLKFKLHEKYYKNIKIVDKLEVVTYRIDRLLNFQDIPNFINLDIQGMELRALKGFGNHLSKVDYIYSEVNKKELYSECALIDEIDSFLENKGFKRITARFYLRQGWGDALYIRKTVFNKLSIANKFKWFFKQFRFYFFYTINQFSSFIQSLRRKLFKLSFILIL